MGWHDRDIGKYTVIHLRNISDKKAQERYLGIDMYKLHPLLFPIRKSLPTTPSRNMEAAAPALQTPSWTVHSRDAA
jgi:hypothetical protein